MKKSLLILICVLFTTLNLHAITDTTYYDNFDNVIRSYAMNVYEEEIREETGDNLYLQFINKSIPSKFVQPFYNFTKDNKNLGIEILGIAKHESNWKWFVGKRNANGSIDLGPLMLNSFNIEDENFMKAFATEECEAYKYDTDIYFMLICINYYKSLRKDFGPFSALQIYNGGWRTVRRNCPAKLKETVVLYANTVYKYINSYSDDYKEYVKENESETEEMFIKKYAFIARYAAMNKSTTKTYMNMIRYGVSVKISRSFPSEHLVRPDMSMIYDKKFYETYILMRWPKAERRIVQAFTITDEDDEEDFLFLDA